MPQKPNIIILYADDLGFGDVGCYGGKAIATPKVDRLAANGLRFNQGYATAATCTPSRYSLLTGSYPWREPRAAILAGDAPQLIAPGTCTLPSLLREAGYATGVVGKWHLGIGEGNPNWNKPLPGTPLDIGFDSSYIMAATNDRVPCVYLDGRDVVNLDPHDPIEVTYNPAEAFPDQPTGRENPELLKMRYSHGHDCSIVNGVSRIGYMRGGKSAEWVDEEMADVFAQKAVSFVEKHADQPFFLYYALHQPHVPRLPAPRFAGSTGLGPRGDVIAELDWCVGQVLDSLERLGIADNTLVIFSSDNGPVLDDGYEDDAVERLGTHKPAGPLRGGKYSMYDGGTRVPFLLSWPAHVQPGVTDALVSHVDFAATFASLAGLDLPEDAAPDSLDLFAALTGKDPIGRQYLVTEGLQARTIIRDQNWAYIPTHKGPRYIATTGNETGNSPWEQLYHLHDDMGQAQNMASDHPDIVAAMSKQLAEIIQSDRTRP